MTDRSDQDSTADHLAMVQLTVDYCWALDTRDWEALRNVFTPDAVADLGLEGQQGIDEIIERVSTALSRFDDTQHLVGSHQIRFDEPGDDRGTAATGRCYLQAQHIRHGIEGGSLFMVAGRYEDRFVRTDTGWRISERRLVQMWTSGNQKILHRRFDE